jgi:hypothetical protein
LGSWFVDVGNGVWFLSTFIGVNDMNKIDLIIDALSIAQNSVWSKLNEEALAAARELKEIDSKLEKARENANKVWEQATGKQI